MTLVKGGATRSAIVDEALRQTARDGLAGLSFGGLADALRLSKSGLFAHFKGKEALQLAVLEEAGARFRQRVLAPTLARRAGRERLLALFARYVDWMGDGCVYSTIAQEIGTLPEPVERAFRDGQRQWQQTIGDVAAAAGVDPQWMAEVTLHVHRAGAGLPTGGEGVRRDGGAPPHHPYLRTDTEDNDMTATIETAVRQAPSRRRVKDAHGYGGSFPTQPNVHCGRAPVGYLQTLLDKGDALHRRHHRPGLSLWRRSKVLRARS